MLLRINGLDTHFTEAGEGDPLLLLHGWGTSSESLAPLSRALSDSFRILAVDLPGFGWSQIPPVAWGTGEYAGHIERLMQETGMGGAAILGHSFGGRVAIRLAAMRPALVSRLVLVASAGVRPQRRVGYHARVAAHKLARRFFTLPGWGAAGRRVIARMTDRVGSRDYRAAGRMRPTLVRVVNEDLAPLLAAVQAPTLILWGDRDEEVPRGAMETMAKSIPQARLQVFEGAGHFPFLDMPEPFCKSVREFLGAGGAV